MTKERIEQLRRTQTELRTFASTGEPPKVLFFADDGSVSIDGNENGLICLALELLEISSGGTVSPMVSDWLGAPWLPLERIALDPDPKFEAKERTIFQRAIGYFVVALVCIVFLVGAIASVEWLGRMIHR